MGEWSPPHTVQVSDDVWEIRSPSNYLLGRVSRRGELFHPEIPGDPHIVSPDLEAAAGVLFQWVKDRKSPKRPPPRPLPPIKLKRAIRFPEDVAREKLQLEADAERERQRQQNRTAD